MCEINEKITLGLIKKILNNNGFYFFRDIKIMWSEKFSKEELLVIKRALSNKGVME